VAATKRGDLFARDAHGRRCSPGHRSRNAHRRAEPRGAERTYRHLGSVYADLEPAQGKEMLIKAKGAYQLAEDLLRGETDGLERAKLNFNYANTLRQLDPNDIRQLEEAKERFLAARVYFVKNAPQYIPQVDTALSSVTALLKIAPLAVTVAKNARDMQALEQECGRRWRCHADLREDA